MIVQFQGIFCVLVHFQCKYIIKVQLMIVDYVEASGSVVDKNSFNILKTIYIIQLLFKY